MSCSFVIGIITPRDWYGVIERSKTLVAGKAEDDLHMSPECSLLMRSDHLITKRDCATQQEQHLERRRGEEKEGRTREGGYVQDR